MDADLISVQDYIIKKLNKNHLNFNCIFNGGENLTLQIKISGELPQEVATEVSKISESVHGGVRLFENDKFTSYMSDALLSERGALKAKTQEGVDTLLSTVLARGWDSAFSRQNKLYKAYKTESCVICAGRGNSTCFPCSGKGRVSCSTCSGSRMTRCRSCSGGYSRCGSCNEPPRV